MMKCNKRNLRLQDAKLKIPKEFLAGKKILQDQQEIKIIKSYES
jgi:hypothetical protein